MKPYILGAIFARGGSKGLPGKNIKFLAGKPLIAHAIEVAKTITFLDKIIVSTDDEEIAKVARLYDADVPFIRPAELAHDNSPELLSWKHAIETMEVLLDHRIDVLVSIPSVAPLRLQEDVEKCVEKLLNTDSDIIVTMTEAHRNPHFNMVISDEEGLIQLAIPPKNGAPFRRQDAPKMYDLTTVAYAAHADYIKLTNSILGGRVRAVVVPRERALDIDVQLDFDIAEYLIRSRLSKKYHE